MLNSFRSRQKIVNLHIPKTAGTSLRDQLRPYYYSLRVKLPEQADIEVAKDYFAAVRVKLQEAEVCLGQLDSFFLFGHFRFADLRQVRGPQLRDASVFTFLREPVARTVSDYYYSTSPTHPGHRDFLQAFPSLDAYMANAGEMNKQFHYLKPHEDATVAETISAVEQGFAFVGIVERFEECGNTLASQLSIPTLSPIHENRNPNLDQLAEAAERHGPALRAALADDLAIYAHFSEYWLST